MNNQSSVAALEDQVKNLESVILSLRETTEAHQWINSLCKTRDYLLALIDKLKGQI